MGNPLSHKYPRGYDAERWGLPIWPIGFQIAPELPDEGRFTTMAFLVPGKPLRINALPDRTVAALIEAVDCNGQPPSGRSFDEAILTIGNQYNTLVCMGRMRMARVSIWPIESYCDFASERPRSIARISNSEWQF